MTEDAGENQGGPGQEPDTTGCPLHERASGDCDPCLAKWGLTRETANRHTLLHPNVLRQRFRPGQSGNAKGRGKGRTMEEVVQAILDEEIPGSDATTRREAMARVLVAEALSSKPKRWAVELIMERVWPKRVSHDVTSTGSLTIVFDDQDRREMESIKDE
jgi:hypothetical protein